MEAPEKDRSLESQLLLSAWNLKSSEEISETAWEKNGCFSDEKADFDIGKKIPENTLCYVNQGHTPTVIGS